MSSFELVIFDCDGVLVDSERLSNQVLADMLNELGASVTLDDMFEQFVGFSMAQILLKSAELLGRAPPDDFVDAFRQRTNAAFAAHLTVVTGVEAVLDAISMPCCVASNGPHGKMRLTLGKTGLLDRFEGRIFSAEDVALGKPAPDLFLHAASHFGVAPSACLVVEDTPTGVAAGIAAGMTVCGYCALTPATRLIGAGAHSVFRDMAQLPALIGRAPEYA